MSLVELAESCTSPVRVCGVGELQRSTHRATALPTQPVPSSGAGRDGTELRGSMFKEIWVLEHHREKTKSSSDGFANGNAFNGGFKIS